MKSKMKQKLVASLILTAFALTNTSIASLAVGDPYGSYGPQLRMQSGTEVGVDSNIDIKNGDSIVNLSLRDADVTQVLRMFADQAGMNIIFADGVGEGSSSEDDKDGKKSNTVTLDLVDIPLRDALNIVVRTKGLFYDIQANTIVVSTKENALVVAPRSRKITVIPVRYVNATAISHFLNKSVFGAKNKGAINSDLSFGMIVATNPATNELIINGTENDIAYVRSFVEQFDRKPQVTTIKVNHTTPAEMATAVCTSLFPSMSIVKDGDGGGESGGAAGIPTGFAADEGGDSSASSGGSAGIAVGGGKLACVFGAYQKTEESESNEKETEKIASLSSLNLLNMSVSYFPTLGTIQIIGGSDSQIQMVREYIAENDKKTPQAYLEMQVVSLSEAGSKDFSNSWQFYSKHFSFNANGDGFKTSDMYPVFFAGHGLTTYDTQSFPYEPNALYSKYSGSPTLVYSVNYLIENSKGRVIANPKVLVTNGQKSVIDLSSDYVKKVTSEYLDNSSLNAQVQRTYDIGEDKGIKIEVTPFISPDGYVTLDITPVYTTISDQVYAPGATGANELQATLLQRRNLEIKGARVKDGETLVIGGLITEDETKSVSKVPILGDLPVIGMFFRSTQTRRNKEEMVMLITPKIVVDTEDAVSNDTNL